MFVLIFFLLLRSASGHELMVCSLDGSIAYLCFTKEELGEPLSLEETVSFDVKGVSANVALLVFYPFFLCSLGSAPSRSLWPKSD